MDMKNFKTVDYMGGTLCFEDRECHHEEVTAICFDEIEDHPQDAIVRHVGVCYGCRPIVGQSMNLNIQGIQKMNEGDLLKFPKTTFEEFYENSK